MDSQRRRQVLGGLCSASLLALGGCASLSSNGGAPQRATPCGTPTPTPTDTPPGPPESRGPRADLHLVNAGEQAVRVEVTEGKEVSKAYTERRVPAGSRVTVPDFVEFGDTPYDPFWVITTDGANTTTTRIEAGHDWDDPFEVVVDGPRLVRAGQRREWVSLTVRNTSQQPRTLTVRVDGSFPVPYSFTPEAITAPLAPGESKTVEDAFPPAQDFYDATLDIGGCSERLARESVRVDPTQTQFVLEYEGNGVTVARGPEAQVDFHVRNDSPRQHTLTLRYRMPSEDRTAVLERKLPPGAVRTDGGLRGSVLPATIPFQIRLDRYLVFDDPLRLDRPTDIGFLIDEQGRLRIQHPAVSEPVRTRRSGPPRTTTAYDPRNRSQSG